jgi:[acyl-carrier-protein] S-malonyltransferase
LGEFSALVAAGALPFAEALRLVRLRGELMQRAVPVGEGAMAAIVGLDRRAITEVLAEVETPLSPVTISGFNSPEQITISGEAAAIGRAVDLLKARGARRIVPLAVSAPFHSALMASAAAALDEELGRVRIVKPAFPIVTNVDAAANTDPLRLRELLVCQVTAPVRWVDSVFALRALGVTRFVELGPGRSISKLISKTDPVAETLQVGDETSLTETAAALR